MPRSLLSFIAVFCFGLVHGQFPKTYFSPPLEIPLTLAGNFGEIRPNHYHFGLDFKTMGKEGLNVRAAAEGYVSRIRVSLYGYGKSVYITHPNGYTTVYAHLKQFSPDLQKYIEGLQTQKESFEVESYFEPGQYTVKKGELLGLSGNTGSSQGPHLHFEIRQTSSESALNPLLFGLPIKDIAQPIIKNVVFYALNDSAFVNNKERMLLAVKQPVPSRLRDTILVNGAFGVGVETFDREAATGSLNGVYDIKLFIDNNLYFELKLDSFSFEYSRYVNSVVDREGALKGLKIQKLFLSDNNMLPVYPVSKNRGKIRFNDNLYHTIKIISTDITGRSTQTSLIVKSINNKNYKRSHDIPKNKVADFSALRTNIYKTEGLMIDVSAYALYDTLEFELTRELNLTPGAFTPVYKIHNENILLQKAIILSFDVKTFIGDTTKLLMVKVKGKNLTACGGEYLKGRFIAETKTFGSYTVTTDTNPPSVQSLLKNKTKSVSTLNAITYKLKDDLSGIKSYKAFVNSKFVIAELDASSGILTFNVKKMNLKPGKNEVVITAVDERGNATKFQEFLIY